MKNWINNFHSTGFPHGGGFSGSSANAQAASSSFGGGFPFGGFSGSAANAAASSNSFGFGR